MVWCPGCGGAMQYTRQAAPPCNSSLNPEIVSKPGLTQFFGRFSAIAKPNTKVASLWASLWMSLWIPLRMSPWMSKGSGYLWQK